MVMYFPPCQPALNVDIIALITAGRALGSLGEVMARAMEMALWVRSVHGITGILTDREIDDLLAEWHVEVVEDRPFASNLTEAMVNGVLFLRKGETRAWQRWDKSHGLGHAVLHAGNQLGQIGALRTRWERQANEFAFWLIFGHPPWPRSSDARTLAEWGDVPEEHVCSFLQTHRDNPAMRRGWAPTLILVLLIVTTLLFLLGGPVTALSLLGR